MLTHSYCEQNVIYSIRFIFSCKFTTTASRILKNPYLWPLPSPKRCTAETRATLLSSSFNTVMCYIYIHLLSLVKINQRKVKCLHIKINALVFAISLLHSQSPTFSKFLNDKISLRIVVMEAVVPKLIWARSSVGY